MAQPALCSFHASQIDNANLCGTMLDADAEYLYTYNLPAIDDCDLSAAPYLDCLPEGCTAPLHAGMLPPMSLQLAPHSTPVCPWKTRPETAPPGFECGLPCTSTFQVDGDGFINDCLMYPHLSCGVASLGPQLDDALGTGYDTCSGMTSCLFSLPAV